MKPVAALPDGAAHPTRRDVPPVLRSHYPAIEMAGPNRPRLLAAFLALVLVPALVWAACGPCGRGPGCATGSGCSDLRAPAEPGYDCGCCAVRQPPPAKAAMELARSEPPTASAPSSAGPAGLHVAPAGGLPSRLDAPRLAFAGPVPSPYLLHGALLI